MCAFNLSLTRAGLNRIHQGKVRDTYLLPDETLLLVVATDRVSIFDFVLPTLIPQKGELLTALTVFWLDEVLRDVNHHLIAFGRNMDKYLPPSLRGMTEIYQRSLIVKKLSMIPVECIVRGYLTGSGWKSYQEAQQVCGIELPSELHDGSRIVPAIFTPTTKAETGHDEHLQTEKVIQQYGKALGDLSLAVYQRISEVAEAKNMILADTKFEFGEGEVLADEVGTPDSSRFWDQVEWALASVRQTSPSPFDKEVVRNWGRQFNLDRRDPCSDEDLAFVRNLKVPQDVLDETNSRYRTVLLRITGRTLEDFQKSKLGVV